ncbi:MAG TPA: manganese catalase family protein [Methylomirabilota bacterium]|nr:manganese catalase family protein [Methylomirabilota bacterium]
MFLRIDRLPVELPASPEVDPVAAKNVQELLGGRFGEMSTLMNYTYQSFGMRGREKVRPYYSLISNIAAEEGGHIEIVSAAINACLNGPRTGFDDSGDPVDAPLGQVPNGPLGLSGHFIASGMTALPVDSRGMPWTGDYVFSSGNLILDLLHNFFLENGARTQKLRVYQMTKNPAAREMLGYLFVRGGVHALAYAKALESLTGVDMAKMLPIPNIGNATFPEARKFMERGTHLKLYRFSPDDYKDAGSIWNGTAPAAYTEGLGGSDKLEFVDAPPSGGNLVNLAGIASAFAPNYAPEEIFEMANKLYQKAKGL